MMMFLISQNIWAQEVISAEWIKSGFTELEARQWQQLGIKKSKDAKHIIDSGFTYNTYLQWQLIDVQGTYQIDKLRQVGITYDKAKQWHDTGINSDEWLAFKKHGIDLEQAQEWSSLGITQINDIKGLIRNGIDLNEAKQWNESGLNSFNWIYWKQDGYSADDASAWAKIGVKTRSQVNDLMRVGIDLPVAAQWYESTLRQIDWLSWHRLGIMPQEAKQWVLIGVNSTSEVSRFLSSGINVLEAAAWKKTGVVAEYEIQRIKEHGLETPEEKEGWDSLGIKDVYQWINNGLSWQDAKEWKDNGFDQIGDVLNWKTKGLDAPSAKVQHKIDQQVAMEKQALEERNEKIKEISFKVGLLIVSFLVLSGLFLGITDSAVFYMDDTDVYLTFTPFILIVISFLLAMFTWSWMGYIGVGVSFITVIFIFYRSYVFNKRKVFKSLATAVAKLVLSFLYVINIIGALSPSGKNTSEKRYARSSSFVWLAFLTPLLYKLVNGERVTAKVTKLK